MNVCASPMRKCTGCNEMKEKSTLIRVVRIGEEAQIDLEQKGQGRGAYICKNSDCLKKAIKKNSFSRALKVRVDEKMYQDLTGVIINADS